MSEITTQLNQQLKNNKENKIIKDESKNRWFTGSEISADVQKLKNEMISLKIGHGDVVLVCLPNTAVYPVIIQAIWELGAIAHPIAATTPKKNYYRC
jgi:Acyl-CoA synthetases (AMP-forming)/AMP-acid ligases II